MSRRRGVSEQRRLQFEEFEKRLLMTVNTPAMALLPELAVASPAIMQQEVSLENAHTQAASIADQYGFDGTGQTVAVIDSGIAWDHYALGGGFGEGNKVVGGWDFAENDADPYDDGPAGFHGTHIAGIIGSTDEQYRGVSSGVDLVGLRVFGDRGEGELEWVEQALQWVHDNKDAFANPITTVNLSLGTDWNADTVPDWGILEDEFAQLKADGIFISVAAGNAFKTFGEAGLSYPAVSEHVVPVASHDADGQLSDFSQRADGVLAAPGELIRSSVPGHLFGSGPSDRFVGSSGTSMSAPYLAGASAVLRQANEFMGVTEVTQEVLYQQFLETADQLYDSITGSYYYRVNLEAALAHVVQDRHADTAETATDLGNIKGSEIVKGTIGKISDVDNFQFVATRSERVTLSFEVTDDLVPLVDVAGLNTTIENNQLSFDVIKGQTYDFSVATAEGSGHYQINFSFDNGKNSSGENGSGSENNSGGSTASPTDWGTVVSSNLNGQKVNGSARFDVSAARTGILTIQANSADHAVEYRVYDSDNNLLASTDPSTDRTRFDLQVTRGEQLTIEVIGDSEQVDFRVDNLVSFEQGHLIVHGTNLDDQITLTSENGIRVNVNGVEYSFDESLVDDIHIVGHHGNDQLDADLGDGNHRGSTRPTSLYATNDEWTLFAYDVANISVQAGTGYSTLSMFGTQQSNSFSAGFGNDGIWGTLTGNGFQSRGAGFDIIHSAATGTNDTAELSGSLQNDRFTSNGDRNMVWNGNGTILAEGYSSVKTDGLGGSDTANIYGTENDDQFRTSPGFAERTSSGSYVSVTDFEQTNVYAGEGFDQVIMNDSAGSDRLYHADGVTVLSGSGFHSLAQGFESVNVIASEGFDLGRIIDSAGNDQFFSIAGDARMKSSGASVSADGFKVVNLISRNGGNDTATVVGTDKIDGLTVDVDSTNIVNANGQTNRLVGMSSTDIDLKDGIDVAHFVGSSAKESFRGSHENVLFESVEQTVSLKNGDVTNFDGNGGGDQVEFEEFEALDLLESIGDKAVAYLRDHTITVEEFELLEARTVDDAIAEFDLEAVDYLYMLRGNWSEKI